MGGGGSAPRTVSFGQDEKEKVTVVEGVKVRGPEGGSGARVLG